MRLFASGGGVVNCGVVKFLKNFFLLFDSDPRLQLQLRVLQRIRSLGKPMANIFGLFQNCFKIREDSPAIA